jgi:protein O-GlcNAc transferase
VTASSDAFGRAVEHHVAGRLAEAAALYQEILAGEPRHADSLHLLGVIATQAGQPALAVDRITQAIALQPDNPAFHVNLGEALRALGRLDDAVASYGEALARQPDLAEAHGNLGIALQALGRLDAARASFEQALALRPDYAEAAGNLGHLLLRLGEPDAALARYDRALASRPDDPPLLVGRGAALAALRRDVEAAAGFERALALRPELAAAHGALADLRQRQGALEAALAHYDQALAFTPRDAILHTNRGVALAAQGKHAPAVAAFRRALQLAPDHADAHNNLGNALQLIGGYEEAVGHYERVLALRPGDPDSLSNLGNARLVLGDVEAALGCFEQALAQRPGDGDLLNSRGRALLQQGRLDAARASFEAAVAACPERAEIHSNLLFLLNYDPTVTDAALLEAHRAFGRRLAGAVPAPTAHGNPAHGNPRDPARVLRIGYVSGDFARHPVGYLCAAVLAAHDRAALRVYGYSGRIVEDALTVRIRQTVDVWRPTAGLDDAALADLIRADGIDILVDLSGHTGGNRLAVFARKPAPVQASWIGYFNTTGLDAIDYVLTDAANVPPGAEQWFTEQVVRLPAGRFCYAAPDDAPAVAPPPSRARGAVTFGSFNNLSKLTPAVIALWAQVVRAVPEARLLLKWRSLADPRERARLLAEFDTAGLAPERIELRPYSPHEAMLAEYADLDIALDPFPFTGGLTSCEALWMGVPVVTLPGSRPVSRQTLGLLAQIGLDALAARDPADYVAIAAGLARDPARLAELRATLRSRMAASPLSDGPTFARGLEAAYRALWRRWCAA